MVRHARLVGAAAIGVLLAVLVRWWWNRRSESKPWLGSKWTPEWREDYLDSAPVPSSKEKKKKQKGKGKGDGKKGGDGGGDEPTPDASGWMSGKMTYYWADEPEKGFGTGNKGAADNKLVPMHSVAVKGKSQWKKYQFRTVEVQVDGKTQKYRVDDYCLGPGCKDLDLYVGAKQGGHDGIKSIKFRFM